MRPEHSELRLAVRVYNYAQVSPAVLKTAQGEAARVFEGAVISLEWIDCPLSPEEAEKNPVCRQAFGPLDVLVRIQPRYQAAMASFRDVTLGFAPLKEGEPGSYASVFHDRVKSLAKGGEFTEALILGHAIAHEIGHLLLRTMTHSSTGIMRAHLGREELKRAGRGQLLFTHRQCELIQAEVERRMQSQADQQLRAIISRP